MAISTPIIFGMVIGFIAGFLFSLWILDRLYKTTFEDYSKEMNEQYLYLLKNQGFNIKEKAP